MSRNLTADEIGAVVGELNIVLRGAVLQDVRQPSPADLHLEFRLPGESFTVLVSASPDLSRIHATESRPRNPPTPLAFQSLLRARLCGERVESIAQLGGDRVATLSFTGGMTLVAELTGRHGNVFLCDGVAIVGSLFPNRSQRRALVPGKPYLPPAPRPPPDQSGFKNQSIELGTSRGPLAFNLGLDHMYADLAAARDLAVSREAARGFISRERRRVARLRTHVETDLAAAGAAGDYSRWGELLKRNLHALRRGMTAATLTEYGPDGPREVHVALKPDLGPRENMDRYFRLARRLSAARTRIEERLRDIERRAAALDRASAQIDGCANQDGIAAILKAAGLRIPAPRAPRRLERAGPRRPYREYFIEGAGRFFVGGSAKDNDALTFRVARGSDLWFHTVGFPGAHVVAPLPRDRQPSQSMIHAGARLAASRSQAPEGEKVEVCYTRQKYLRKPKGAAPGLVTVAQERRILVTVEKGLFTDCIVEEVVPPQVIPPSQAPRTSNPTTRRAPRR